VRADAVSLLPGEAAGLPAARISVSSDHGEQIGVALFKESKDSDFNGPSSRIGGCRTPVNRALAWSSARKLLFRAAYRRTVTRLDRRSTPNRRRGMPPTQADPAWATRSWSPGQALIEFDLRQWLGGLPHQHGCCAPTKRMAGFGMWL